MKKTSPTTNLILWWLVANDGNRSVHRLLVASLVPRKINHRLFCWFSGDASWKLNNISIHYVRYEEDYIVVIIPESLTSLSWRKCALLVLLLILIEKLMVLCNFHQKIEKFTFSDVSNSFTTLYEIFFLNWFGKYHGNQQILYSCSIVCFILIFFIWFLSVLLDFRGIPRKLIVWVAC